MIRPSPHGLTVRADAWGMLSTDQTLKGLGLVIVLALACRLVSGRLRLPAIVLLLPVGFAAGTADNCTISGTTGCSPGMVS